MMDKPESKLLEGENGKVGAVRLETRRDFTKKGVAGTAVLLTLANRPAWGTQTMAQINKDCISKAMLISASIANSVNPSQRGKIGDWEDAFDGYKGDYRYTVRLREEGTVQNRKVCKVLCKLEHGSNSCHGENLEDW